MRDFIDTNLVLRYLTGTPEDQHRRARAVIDSDQPLVLTAVVLVEASYTLRSQYGISRERIVDVLTELVSKQNIELYELDRAVVIEALQLCRPSNRVNFGDALIWAAVRCAQPARLYSFDRRFPTGIELRRP